MRVRAIETNYSRAVRPRAVYRTLWSRRVMVSVQGPPLPRDIEQFELREERESDVTKQGILLEKTTVFKHMF